MSAPACWATGGSLGGIGNGWVNGGPTGLSLKHGLTRSRSSLVSATSARARQGPAPARPIAAAVPAPYFRKPRRVVRDSSTDAVARGGDATGWCAGGSLDRSFMVPSRGVVGGVRASAEHWPARSRVCEVEPVLPAPRGAAGAAARAAARG